MKILTLAALVALSLIGFANAQTKAPATKDFRKPLPGTNSTYMLRNKGECTKPFQHREWRKMSKQNQQDFLNAVKCSTTKAAILTKKAKGAKNRFDDFCAVHIIQADTTHVVGHFLPWHRLYIAMYEEYLAAECGYTGGMPYWDYALDAADEKTFLSSPVLAPDAFGGNGLKTTQTGAQQGGFAMNGRTGGGCIQDGAFKDFVVNMGPNTSLKGNPRCIQRDLVPNLISNFKPAAIAKLMAAKTHAEFDSIIEQTPNFSGGGIDWNNSGVHNGAHFILGGSFGTLGNTYASCGDPAFFLVHGYLDKLWWDWQNSNANRLYEIGGKQANGQPVTLDLAMTIDDLTAPYPFTVRDVMDIKAGPLCYEYKD